MKPLTILVTTRTPTPKKTLASKAAIGAPPDDFPDPDPLEDPAPVGVVEATPLGNVGTKVPVAVAKHEDAAEVGADLAFELTVPLPPKLHD